MESSKLNAVILKNRSSVSLHERFTQVLMDQLTRTVTFDPTLLTKEEEPPLGVQAPHVHQRAAWRLRMRRRSLWTHGHASRLGGYCSFMNKYRRRRRGHLRGRSHVHRLTGTHLKRKLPRGGASTARGRGLRRDGAPTKRQLDAQLDDYMSMSKRQLDKDLDDYMSMSRRRLDAELDDYMCLLD